MAKRLTRQQLYALAWEKPMTKLAKEFGLSDVALHKICRKHHVPTPPPGYWGKKEYGKRVTNTPLPNPGDPTEIVIRESTASNEPVPIAEARAAIAAAIAAAQPAAQPTTNGIVERTVTKLANAKSGRDGLVRCEGKGLVRVTVRSESTNRAGTILRGLVAAGERAGLRLTKHGAGAAWQCDGETISFEIIEAPDQVPHVATQQELDAVAKWKRQREETHRRYGYWRDWGEPRIPKWERRFQGRLAIRLEEVRIENERSPWGQAIRRNFADSGTREVAKAFPRIVATIAAISAAKKFNREIEAQRCAAAKEAERQWAEGERRRQLDERAGRVLEQLLSEKDAANRLRAVVEKLKALDQHGPRTEQFLAWAKDRVDRLERCLESAALEERLATSGLFES